MGNASWMIGSGSTKPPYNGPSNDHTLGLNICCFFLIIKNKRKIFL
jgi:hypothetical protein